MQPFDDIRRSAMISTDGLYRYWLERRWNEGKALTWVLLNPSKANAEVDDATIRRIVGFSKRWGWPAALVLNLFALRSTDPAALYTAANPVGPDNDQWLARYGTNNKVVAAWGNHGKHLDRDLKVAQLLRMMHANVVCLGTTKQGCPKHPLRLSYETKLVPLPRYQ